MLYTLLSGTMWSETILLGAGAAQVSIVQVTQYIYICILQVGFTYYRIGCRTERASHSESKPDLLSVCIPHTNPNRSKSWKCSPSTEARRVSTERYGRRLSIQHIANLIIALQVCSASNQPTREEHLGERRKHCGSGSGSLADALHTLPRAS